MHSSDPRHPYAELTNLLRFSTEPVPFDKVDDYWVANGRAALASPDGRWEVAVYGTNLFDEEYISYINNISFFALSIFGELRTFGAPVAYRFE